MDLQIITKGAAVKKVLLDGKQLEGVTGVSFNLAPFEIPTFNISLVPDNVKYDGEDIVVNFMPRGIIVENCGKKVKCPTDEDRAKMYSTYEFNEYGNRHAVTVLFELAYHDWLKLENSKEFRDMVDYLWELKTTDDRHVIREGQG